MNEHIKQLAEKSGLKVESWMTNPPKPFQVLGSAEDFEKFAELIVKECAAMTRNLSPHGELAEKAVKEYFGVEE